MVRDRLTFENVPPGAIVLLAGAWLLSLVTQGFIILPSTIVDPITRSTGVDASTAVWLVSVTLGAWAATNFLIGTMIDRYGDVAVTTLGVVLFVGASLWCWQAGLRGDFLSLLGARALGGVAIGSIWTAGANLVGRAFERFRRFRRSEPTAIANITPSGPSPRGRSVRGSIGRRRRVAPRGWSRADALRSTNPAPGGPEDRRPPPATRSWQRNNIVMVETDGMYTGEGGERTGRSRHAKRPVWGPIGGTDGRG